MCTSTTRSSPKKFHPQTCWSSWVLVNARPGARASATSKSNSSAAQLHRRAVAGDLVPRDVDDQAVELEPFARVRRLTPAATPQHRASPGDQLAWAERLGDVVVGTDREPDHLVDLVRASREHDHVDTGLGSELTQHLDAVDPGHHHVEQHHIGTPLTRSPERFRTVPGKRNVEALGLEIAGEELADPGFVVGDQHSRLRRSRHAPRP